MCLITTSKNKIMAWKSTYKIGNKEIETFSKPTLRLLKWQIKCLKQTNGYNLGKFTKPMQT